MVPTAKFWQRPASSKTARGSSRPFRRRFMVGDGGFGELEGSRFLSSPQKSCLDGRRDAGRGCLLILGWRYPRPNFGRGRLLFGKYDRPEGAGMRRAMDGIGKRWIRTKKRPPIEDRSRCGGRCDAGDDDVVVVVVVRAVVGSWCSSCEMCNDFFIFKLLIGRSDNGSFAPSFIFQLEQNWELTT